MPYVAPLQNILSFEDPAEIPRKQRIDELISKIMRHESPLSFSSLRNFKESPADFIAYKFREIEQTEAMVYGSMVHCLVLEPKEFYNRYFVIDDAAKKAEIGGAKPGATSAYKAWVAEQTAKAGEKIVITAGDWEIADGIAKGVLHNGPARRIMEVCPEREVAADWIVGNYKFKGFIDGKGKSAKFDLKTVQDANPRKVQRDIMNNAYYLQGAMYQSTDIETVKDQDYYIIAVDKKGGISCHQLKKNLLDKGRKEFEYLTNKFSEAVLTNAWDKSYEFHADRWDGIYDADKLW